MCDSIIDNTEVTCDQCNVIVDPDVITEDGLCQKCAEENHKDFIEEASQDAYFAKIEELISETKKQEYMNSTEYDCLRAAMKSFVNSVFKP